MTDNIRLDADELFTLRTLRDNPDLTRQALRERNCKRVGALMWFGYVSHRSNKYYVTKRGLKALSSP